MWKADASAREEKAERSRWTAWTRGTTGVPLVDAFMRELAATGFMGNRGRQIVASFLCRDLKVDWRLGAMHFEHALLDSDTSSNYGNWTYVAGVGCDPREDRYFNVPKQGRTHDPDGRFIRAWLPEECVGAATGALLNPWGGSGNGTAAIGYPGSPIVEQWQWGRGAKGKGGGGGHKKGGGSGRRDTRKSAGRRGAGEPFRGGGEPAPQTGAAGAADGAGGSGQRARRKKKRGREKGFFYKNIWLNSLDVSRVIERTKSQAAGRRQQDLLAL